MKHNPKFIYPKSTTRSSVDGHRHYDLGAAKASIGYNYSI
jgi:hypothetical protein